MLYAVYKRLFPPLLSSEHGTMKAQGVGVSARNGDLGLSLVVHGLSSVLVFGLQ